jgi:hypothetical protein
MLRLDHWLVFAYAASGGFVMATYMAMEKERR